ncbi:MAG: AgmX/PglI C-terminal domain-containing protein [Myxococcales bacterium]
MVSVFLRHHAMLRMFSAALSGSFLLACAPGEYAKIKAPGYLRCAPEEIGIRRVDVSYYRASGCNRSMLVECGRPSQGCWAHPSADAERQSWCAARAQQGEIANSKKRASRAGESAQAVDLEAQQTQDLVETSASGSLPKAAIRAVMQNLALDVRACLECTLARSPGEDNIRLPIRFVVESDGHVSEAHPLNQASDPQLASCVTGVISEAQFPKPEGGGIVIVEYPYVLEMR